MNNEKNVATLYAYNNGSFNSAEEAGEQGGAYPITDITFCGSELIGVAEAEQLARATMAVFGMASSLSFYIGNETDARSVIFIQDNLGWHKPAEPVEDKVEQVTIPVTIFITATGTNISVKEAEIRAALVSVFEDSINHDDGDKFDSEFADLDFSVVETKVLCTEPIIYTAI